MEINLRNLESALKALQDLPNTAIVHEHAGAPDLSAFIKGQTKNAEAVISEIIDLIREKATLQVLIEQGEKDR